MWARSTSHTKAILALLLASLPLALWLIARELETPGTCPKLLGLPACFVVLALMLVVLAAKTVQPDSSSTTVVGVTALIGLGIAIWFSSQQILGRDQCPELLHVPLCYVALTAWATVLVLTVAERRDGQRAPGSSGI